MPRATRSMATATGAATPVMVQAAPVAPAAAAAGASTAKRGRGRPRREAAAPAAESLAPKPRGGKRKAASAEPEVEAAAAEVQPVVDVAEPVATAAAAGRPPKRAKKAPAAKAASKSAAAPASVPCEGFKHGTLTRDFEASLLVAQGLDPATSILVGVDEAGRGPLAGPVVCAAAYVPADVCIDGVNDSKAMSADERDRVFAELTAHPRVKYAVATLEHTEIDRINILEATMKGMADASNALKASLPNQSASMLLVDGNRIPPPLLAPGQPPVQFVIKGDSRAYCIAAASILAKVTRDRIMDAHHATWPQYNFAQHKGYGVAAHMSAIHKHGPCPIHRRTFAPMKHMKIKDDEEKKKEHQEGDTAAAVEKEEKKGKKAPAASKAAKQTKATASEAAAASAAPSTRKAPSRKK